MLTKEGIKIKAYHYSKYGDDDYEWTKEIATPVIKGICIEKGWYFDIDDPNDPFFISFCKTENYDYMWECFNRDQSGVALVFDRIIIENHACKDLNPDAFMDCIYTDNPKEMKSFLLDFGWDNYNIETINDQQGDLKDLSTFIIKPKHMNELECRYVILHRKNMYFSSDGEFDEEEIGKTDYVEILFPKEALVGVIIGPQSDVEPEEIVDILRQNNYGDHIKIDKK